MGAVLERQLAAAESRLPRIPASEGTAPDETALLRAWYPCRTTSFSLALCFMY